MASLELRSDRFRIVFRVRGKKLHASLKTTDQREAEGCLARLEENLWLMERGRLIPPPGAYIPTVLLSDGKVAEKLHLPEQALTLEAVIPHEANGLDGTITNYTLERFDAPPLATVLAECKRVLRPGGRIVVIGVSGACERGPDCDQIYIRRMLTAAGFAIKEAEVRRMWAPIEIVLAVKASGPAMSYHSRSLRHIAIGSCRYR